MYEKIGSPRFSRVWRSVKWAGSFLAGCLVAQNAFGQQAISVNAHTFRPALGPENVFMVEGTRTPGKWKPMVLGVFEWSHRPLRLVDRDNNNNVIATIGRS